MTPHLRAAVAFIAGSLVSGIQASAVRDRSSSQRFRISGTIGAESVRLYDHDRDCFVSGNFATIYDYGAGTYLRFSVFCERFDGLDHASGFHFNGVVSGRSISIYDYEHGRYFGYSI